ncbi:MAG: glycosyltransferase family 4 protein [Candidatus Hydrogenedentes bacterium]|nr:glycosyltransferase family 4 protein [Candidatus Hydrogenedentota bacterium]
MIIGVDGRPANEANRAGIGRLCHNLLRALPPLLGDDRLRVYLDAPPRDDFPITPEQAEFRVLHRRRIWTQRVLARELRRDPPDVFYSTTLQLPARRGCPGVATVLDLAFYDFGAYFPWRRRMRARVEARLAVSRATHLIAISEATKAGVLQRFGLPQERISVAYPGVAEGFRPRDSADGGVQARARFGLPERYVLYVGRLQPRKNLVRLVHAFERVLARRPELPHGLVIAGGAGWMEKGLHKAIARSPVKPRIVQPGYVDEADLPGLMAGADVLALVSLWEGFGLPLLEAMHCGTPVLASNCSSLPEVAGEAGALVDPYDVDAIAASLERLLTDDAWRAQKAQAGAARARQFTWERFAGQVLAALRRTAARHPL